MENHRRNFSVKPCTRCEVINGRPLTHHASHLHAHERLIFFSFPVFLFLSFLVDFSWNLWRGHSFSFFTCACWNEHCSSEGKRMRNANVKDDWLKRISSLFACRNTWLIRGFRPSGQSLLVQTFGYKRLPHLCFRPQRFLTPLGEAADISDIPRGDTKKKRNHECRDSASARVTDLPGHRAPFHNEGAELPSGYVHSRLALGWLHQNPLRGGVWIRRGKRLSWGAIVSGDKSCASL